MAKTNYSLTADFEILKTKLGAMIVKNTSGVRMLVLPTTQEEAPAVSLNELISELGKLGATDASVKTNITTALSGVGIDTNNITFSLKMLYFLSDSSNGKKEFAINIIANTEGVIPDQLKVLVNLKKIGVAVWNTERAVILNRMAIADIDSFLGTKKATATTTNTKATTSTTTNTKPAASTSTAKSATTKQNIAAFQFN